MRNNKCKDHLGKEFNTQKEMAEYWGVKSDSVSARLKLGWSLEEALTIIDGRRNNKCKDHLGNEFNTKKKMAEHYGIDNGTLNKRLSYGWSLEEALTTPVEALIKSIKCKDHLGKEFDSMKEMCEYWKVNPRTFKDRLELGWSIEKSLTTKSNIRRGKCKDHLGKEFNSRKEMAEYWGVTRSMLDSRLAKGWSLEKTLITKNKKGNTIHELEDPITKKICKIDELCEKYNISKSSLLHNLKFHNSLRAFRISFMIKPSFSKFNQTKYNLTVHKRITPGKDVFECYINNGDGTSSFKIMTYDMIDKYCLEQYKKLHNIA